ncbi:MAG: antitoxin [Actinomycetaceae bacterium]|nr:antitoxin [Actinomycetaceae bacterium]
MLEELKNKAKEALSNEETTDTVLDKAADAAKQATGGKYDDKIDQAREQADSRLGTE